MGKWADKILEERWDRVENYSPTRNWIPSCDRCGQKNLTWKVKNGRWVLHERVSNQVVLHNCALKKAFKCSVK